MTPELLASIVAMLISLAASYLPGFSDWYSALLPAYKRLLMLTLLALTAAGSFAIACVSLAIGNAADTAQAAGLALACDQASALTLFKAFLAALLANQATYTITKPSHTASIPLTPERDAVTSDRGSV